MRMTTIVDEAVSADDSLHPHCQATARAVLYRAERSGNPPARANDIKIHSPAAVDEFDGQLL